VVHVYATTFIQAFRSVVICILLVFAELAAVVVIVAPRAVARKMKALVAGLIGSVRRISTAPWLRPERGVAPWPRPDRGTRHREERRG
jgi:hypothetical protein